ncbi:MAG: BlaI/MecI/CopY family transcriptional regulator [Bacteroides sp.]|nr:BlaI/MecI/CopY family transcriptional regulator [Bacteroides sp.]
MKAGRKKQILTEKETTIMNLLWNNGPMFVREIVAHMDEPRPHFNTVATQVRLLEEKGYVAHEVFGNSHRFYAVVEKDNFRKQSLAQVIRNYFDNSYKNVVSALAKEEKISVEELQEIIELMERNKTRDNNNS